jgi:hypothetical protein
LLNAAARRVGFEMPQLVSRAVVQTKSAVNTPCIIFVNRLQPRDILRFAQEIKFPPTRRPRAKVSPGSNAFFVRR